MVTNLETRKLALITFIATLQQEEAMIAFEQLLDEFVQKARTSQSKAIKTKVEHSTKIKPKSKISKTDLEYFKRPMRADVNVDDLAKEQNWQPIDEKKMDALVQQMAITEPIELLLAQLKP
ncbi:MAG: hypothetical protein RLZZ628_3723 [Bacteroidota bacterium]|jgi:hypothetical protein